MMIYKHNFKEKTVVEFTDDEFILIQYLLEKNSKNKDKDSLSNKMFNEMNNYEL